MTDAGESAEAVIQQTESLAVLYALYDRRYLTMKELAHMTNVSEAIVKRVLQGLHRRNHLVILEQRGRNYFQLTARYHEQLRPYFSQYTDDVLPVVSALKMTGLSADFKKSRTCYRHLAGQLGVDMTEMFLREQYLFEDEQSFRVSQKGAVFFAKFGVDTTTLQKNSRVFAKKCLDRSERRFHLGGALGEAWCTALFSAGWLHQAESSRIVAVTDQGRRQLAEYAALP